MADSQTTVPQGAGDGFSILSENSQKAVLDYHSRLKIERIWKAHQTASEDAAAKSRNAGM